MSYFLTTITEVESGRELLKWEKFFEVDMPKNTKQKKSSELHGKVEAVDIGHALRASLQFEQSDGARTTSYSSLEIGIQMHIKIPEDYQEGEEYKKVVDAYADETLKMVDDRMKQDARRIGLVSITEQPEEDRFEDFDRESDIDSIDNIENVPLPDEKPKAKKKKGKSKKKK